MFLGAFVTFANALDKTSTGFYWPIGEADPSTGNGWWLSKDPDYFDDLYHIGVDMMTRTSDPNNENSHVYAIADGKVVYTHQSSDWGVTGTTNNFMVLIQHETKGGVKFIAYYGHLQLTGAIKKGGPITAGQYIGYTGDYSTGIHLHFGIREGLSITPSPWGRLPVSEWPETNDFTDPIAFIKNNAPNNWLSTVSHQEYTTCVGDICWGPEGVSCEDANSWYRMREYPFANQVADSSICNEVHREVEQIIQSREPVQEVPKEYWWQKWWQALINFFGSTANADDIRQFYVTRTISVIKDNSGDIYAVTKDEENKILTIIINPATK